MTGLKSREVSQYDLYPSPLFLNSALFSASPLPSSSPLFSTHPLYLHQPNRSNSGLNSRAPFQKIPIHVCKNCMNYRVSIVVSSFILYVRGRGGRGERKREGNEWRESYSDRLIGSKALRTAQSLASPPCMFYLYVSSFSFSSSSSFYSSFNTYLQWNYTHRPDIWVGGEQRRVRGPDNQLS